MSKYEAKRKRQNKNGTESLYHVKVLRCLNNKCMNVRYNDVEEAILDYFRLFQSLNDKELTNLIEDMVHSHENKNNIKSQKQINEQFEQREKELQNKLNFIFDKYESGIYSDEIFLQRKATLDKEMKELKKPKMS